VEVEAVSEGYADVNGVRLHYVSEGTGETILFLHGFPEFWYAWKRQLAEFGRDHRAVAVDLRGYNLSSKPDDVEQYRVGVLVEDIRSLIHHLGAEQVTLVGHDWGGVLAWAFVLQYPELVRRLIIINAPHPAIFARELMENPAQQQASQYMLIFRGPQAEAILAANDYARLADGVLATGKARGTFDVDDERMYRAAWSQPGALTGGLNYYRAARVGPATGSGGPTGDLTQNLTSPIVRVPTLVIWGERDEFLLTGNLDGLDALVPDLQVARVPDATHWVIHEQPDLVNRLIRQFIEN
jgi:pimeloyl-ACP methyl ester carboxylesterase